MKSSVLALSLLLLVQASGERILAFLPIPVKSHQRVFQPLLRELAARGHHVTTVTTLKMDNPPATYNEILLPNYMELLQAKIEETRGERLSEEKLLEMRRFPMIMTIVMRQMGVAMTELVLQNDKVQKLIRSDLEFDAVLLESSFIQEAYVTLHHRYRAAFIEILPVGNIHWSYWVFGNPYDPSYIVDFTVAYTDHMSFLERLHNTVNSLTMRAVWFLYYMPKYQALADKYVQYPGWEERPPLMDMLRNVSLVLVNTDLAFNYPYPMAPHFQQVGGLNLVPAKPLPKDLQKFMDSAKDGVIYFTMGSHLNVSNALNDNLKTVFKNVFSSLKQKVLWKWENKFTDLPPNVLISDWFPQQDILAHKNMKLFITHGGFLSLTESINNGVPMIGIPVLGDQCKNVRHMTNFGYGYHLDFDNITESTLKEAINTVITDSSYKNRVMERRSLYLDKEMTALERAVFWTEYVLRHKGAAHLRPAVTRLAWYQAALLDVYLTLVLALLTLFYLIFAIIRSMFTSSNKRPRKLSKLHKVHKRD